MTSQKNSVNFQGRERLSTIRQSPIRIAVKMAEGSSPKLSNVADVEIDANGRFKYVLIKVTDESQGGVYKHIVRGFDWADYHGRFHSRLPFHSKEIKFRSSL